MTYFDNPMTGFVDHINTANQSIDRKKKLPANVAEKIHCRLYQNKTIRCGVCSMAAKGDMLKKLVKGGTERSVNDNCRQVSVDSSR